MGLVYKHAYCIIATVAATNVSIEYFVQEEEGDSMVPLPGDDDNAAADTSNAYIAKPSRKPYFDVGPILSAMLTHIYLSSFRLGVFY